MLNQLSTATVKGRVPRNKLARFSQENKFGWGQICSFLEEGATAVKYPPPPPQCNAPAAFPGLIHKVRVAALTTILVPLGTAA